MSRHLAKNLRSDSSSSVNVQEFDGELLHAQRRLNRYRDQADEQIKHLLSSMMTLKVSRSVTLEDVQHDILVSTSAPASHLELRTDEKSSYPSPSPPKADMPKFASNSSSSDDE